MPQQQHHKPVTLPVPPPVPIAGGGGPDSYQSHFNAQYYAIQRAEVQPFFYGRVGGQAGTPLTPDEAMALADTLFEQGIEFDEEIGPEGMDAYATQYQRKVVYGFTRVPTGQGNKGPVIVVNPADLVGPVVKGFLLVSVDIADYRHAPVV